MVQQIITLKSRHKYGRRPPSEQVGEVLRTLSGTVRQSVRMATEGRSAASGKRPAWLKAASDIRFLGLEGHEDTDLILEVPTLGEAAPDLYQQQEFWYAPPTPHSTGLDLLAGVISDVAERNQDSDRFDKRLLKQVSQYQHVLNGRFQEIVIAGSAGLPARSVTQEVIAAARELSRATPRSHAVRIMGLVDMVRVSTRTFGLKLDDGNEVKCVLAEGEILELASRLQQSVLVLGRAVFRPSGKLLRVDAMEILPSSNADRLFSKTPEARARTVDIPRILREQDRRGGIAAVFGRWPGDESDEEIEAALQDLS